MNKTQSIISAIVVLLLFIANQLGWSVSENELVEVVSAIALLAGILWGVWKNHNFTCEACDAQEVLKILKDPSINEENELFDWDDGNGQA